jgi:hypothetical protein
MEQNCNKKAGTPTTSQQQGALLPRGYKGVPTGKIPQTADAKASAHTAEPENAVIIP